MHLERDIVADCLVGVIHPFPRVSPRSVGDVNSSEWDDEKRDMKFKIVLHVNGRKWGFYPEIGSKIEKTQLTSMIFTGLANDTTLKLARLRDNDS